MARAPENLPRPHNKHCALERGLRTQPGEGAAAATGGHGGHAAAVQGQRTDTQTNEDVRTRRRAYKPLFPTQEVGHFLKTRSSQPLGLDFFDYGVGPAWLEQLQLLK